MENQGFQILCDKSSHKNKFYDYGPGFGPLFPEFWTLVGWVMFPWAVLQSFATSHW